MGRFISSAVSGKANTGLATITGDKIPTGKGYIYPFGSNNSMFWTSVGTHDWTVPSGITQIRARVLGGGGGGNGGETSGVVNKGTGGGGGGFAMGVFDVTPGDVITVTVGAFGEGGRLDTGNLPSSGGTSSVGALISATGGGAGTLDTTPSTAIAGGRGGAGTGGDFQADGGTAFSSSPAGEAGGGGGAGSQLGNGGDARGRGGAGVLFGTYPGDYAGASAYGSPYERDNGNFSEPGPNILGERNADSLDNPLNTPMRFVFEFFTGRGGFGEGIIEDTLGQSGGGGGSNGNTSLMRGGGGVGGGSAAMKSTSGNGGTNRGGGIGGGGGGNQLSDDNAQGASGGSGIVILEW
jgi:hypothetical protein